MELAALLCNHAEAQNNMLYVAGGGINRHIVPAGRSQPFTVSLGIGIIVEVPWMESDQEHTVDIALVDADGHPVEVPKGLDESEPFRAQFRFNVARPDHVEAGDTQSAVFAINVPVLRLEKLGSYVFVISIDETITRRLDYRLVAQTA